MKSIFVERLWKTFKALKNAKTKKKFSTAAAEFNRLIPQIELLSKVMAMSASDGAVMPWLKTTAKQVLDNPRKDLLAPDVLKRLKRVVRDRCGKEVPSFKLIYHCISKLGMGFWSCDEVSPLKLEAMAKLQRASNRMVRECKALGLVDQEPPRAFSLQALVVGYLVIWSSIFERAKEIDWHDEAIVKATLSTDFNFRQGIENIVRQGNLMLENQPWFCPAAVDPLSMDNVAEYLQEILPFAWAVMLSGEFLYESLMETNLPVLGVLDDFGGSNEQDWDKAA